MQAPELPPGQRLPALPRFWRMPGRQARLQEDVHGRREVGHAKGHGRWEGGHHGHTSESRGKSL